MKDNMDEKVELLLWVFFVAVAAFAAIYTLIKA